jgi:hypothetical protein
MPKKEVNKTDLQENKQYYIQDTRRKLEHLITVYKGTFIKKNGDMNNFRNVEFVVNPLKNAGKPLGFSNKKGFKFLEVLDSEAPVSELKSSSMKRSSSSSRRRTSSSKRGTTSKRGGKKYRKRKHRFSTVKRR